MQSKQEFLHAMMRMKRNSPNEYEHLVGHLAVLEQEYKNHLVTTSAEIHTYRTQGKVWAVTELLNALSDPQVAINASKEE